MKNNIVVRAKNVAIAFFVLVFIMGFFSKSIINLFLPKVIVESAIDGLVERTLNVKGIIEAKKSIKVRLGGSVIVDEYLVKIGEAVEVGTPLFRIDKSYGIKGNSSGLESLKLQLSAQRLKLNNTRQTSYELDEMNITAMSNKLAKSEEELTKQQELFDAGFISKQELESFEAGIEQQMFDIEVSRMQLLEEKRNNELVIKELENEIKNSELQILELQGQQGFYSNVDEEGICYSTISGIVTELGDEQSIVPGDTAIVEIADISSINALVYTISISEEDYDFVKAVGEVQINSESIKDSEYLKITSINKQDDKGLYRVEAVLENQSIESAAIGQTIKGVIKQKFVLKGHNKVPKAAVITFEDYKENSSGTVYLLEENEGVLGMEYRAKAMEVKILAVGDNDVIVSGLENIEEPKVIVNLSYKINDGVKVFLWQ
ncbi:MAG: efflux RND transporter periplasmic adaptor subunit [Lutisporaceae bacterium]